MQQLLLLNLIMLIKLIHLATASKVITPKVLEFTKSLNTINSMSKTSKRFKSTMILKPQKASQMINVQNFTVKAVLSSKTPSDFTANQPMNNSLSKKYVPQQGSFTRIFLSLIPLTSHLLSSFQILLLLLFSEIIQNSKLQTSVKRSQCNAPITFTST